MYKHLIHRKMNELYSAIRRGLMKYCSRDSYFPRLHIHLVWSQWDTVIFLISMSHSCPTHWTQVLPTYWVNNHSLHTFLLCLFITPFHQIPLCLTAHLQHQSSSNWTRVSGGSIGCPTWLRTLISSVPVPTPEFWYRPTVTVPLWPN